MITSRVPFSRITLRGKLFRNGVEWPLPVNDQDSAVMWRIEDVLMVGDVAELPSTTRIRSVIVGIYGTSRKQGRFRPPVADYLTLSHVTCQGCEKTAQLKIEVRESDDYPVLVRECACGREMIEDGNP